MSEDYKRTFDAEVVRLFARDMVAAVDAACREMPDVDISFGVEWCDATGVVVKALVDRGGEKEEAYSFASHCHTESTITAQLREMGAKAPPYHGPRRSKAPDPA